MIDDKDQRGAKDQLLQDLDLVQVLDRDVENLSGNVSPAWKLKVPLPIHAQSQDCCLQLLLIRKILDSAHVSRLLRLLSHHGLLGGLYLHDENLHSLLASLLFHQRPHHLGWVKALDMVMLMAVIASRRGVAAICNCCGCCSESRCLHGG